MFPIFINPSPMNFVLMFLQDKMVLMLLPVWQYHSAWTSSLEEFRTVSSQWTTMGMVVMSSIIRVFSALTLVALVHSQKAIQEGCWRHESSFDDVTSPTTALWVQDVCVSKLRCIALCSSRSTCNAVFHDPISAQCQGHQGFVMAKNTRPKAGTTFFIRNSPLRGTSSSISSHPPRLTSQHTGRVMF